MDIVLTKQQKKVLSDRMGMKNSYEARVAGSRANKTKCLSLRKKCQEMGRVKARARNPDYIAGCMLYWSEGHRKNNKNMVHMCNSDPNILKLFLKFLFNFFNVKKKEVLFCVNHYDDIVPLEDAESYWMNQLGLTKDNRRKGCVNNLSKYSFKKRSSSLKYGTCHLRVHRTDVLQEIYGSIQEYGHFENPEWLG